jgi:hypothetical protein
MDSARLVDAASKSMARNDTITYVLCSSAQFGKVLEEQHIMPELESTTEPISA